MSTPVTPQFLLPLIIEYLESLKNSPNNSLKLADIESYEVALSCLKDSTNTISERSNSARNSIPYNLEQLINNGLSNLESKGNTVSEWRKFASIVSEKGGFGDDMPGTEGYAVKLMAAKNKWNQKFTNVNANTNTANITSNIPNNNTAAAANSTKLADTPMPISESDKKQAEQYKTEGNTLLSTLKYSEAIASYTKAININSQNAIYYTNRAVAHINLKQWTEAINDCNQAIQIDPNYTKAHYRLGQAYFNNNQYNEAKSAWDIGLQKAANDPDMSNTIKQNLQQVNQKLNPSTNTGGGFDFASLLNNPEIANLASQLGGAGGGGAGGLDFASLMKDPNIMNMAANLFGGGGGGGSSSTGGGSNSNNASSSTSSSNNASTSPSTSSSSSNEDPISKFLNSPAAAQLKNDPELKAAIDDVEKNGQGAILKYMNNPSIMNKLTSLLGIGGNK